jgi:N6-L-threonylcarbamoyladenine synthase
LIGTLTARTLAILHNKPLYAVHHLKSHVYANWLTSETGLASLPQFPLLALVVSGGHTQILYMTGHNQFEIIGTTHDDAVGECFDKVAKILGLPYPGGPSIARAALGETAMFHSEPRPSGPSPWADGANSRAAALRNAPSESTAVSSGDSNRYRLPHPKVEGLDFSFSGLKTAVLRAVQKEVGVPISYPSHKLKELLAPQQVADFAASFQKTAVDILCEKLSLAMNGGREVQSVVLAGGVSANKALREALPEAYFPAPELSGDNGAMVAAACYYEIISGIQPTNPYKLNIYPRVSIES